MDYLSNCHSERSEESKDILRSFTSFRMTIILFFILCTHAFADGSIVGTVKFEGNAPHSKLIHMDADPVCYAVNRGNVKSQTIIVGDNNTLADAFVYIKSGLTKTDYPAPTDVAVINQGGCNYTPHVIGVMKGQKVKFLNPDGTLHNVHGICQINPEFNVAMPDFRKEMEITFDKPEFMSNVMSIHGCRHGWRL